MELCVFCGEVTLQFVWSHWFFQRFLITHDTVEQGSSGEHKIQAPGLSGYQVMHDGA